MILKNSLKMLKKHPLCDNCLGRQFALLGTGTTNEERGLAIKETLIMEADEEIRKKDDAKKMKILSKSSKKAIHSLKRRGYKEHKKQSCYLCNELFKDIELYAEKALNKLEEIEYETFLVGTKLNSSLTKKEENFWAKFGAEYSESIKSEINREIGKYIENKTNKTVDFKKPDLVIHFNTKKEKIELNINPLYIYGRYRKLKRNIPQTEWKCPVCRGEGCMRCDDTGHLYETSVEEIVSEPLIKETKGKETVFHGAGREDVNVKMLGDGRPFVIEVKEPQYRKIDLDKLNKQINLNDKGIEVKELEFSNKEKVKEIKEARAPKVYVAKIKKRDISRKELKNALNKIENKTITQKTPKRISRRTDRTRKRKLNKAEIRKIEEDNIYIEFETEAGLYIKELISGDEGRTKPNLASLLGKELECKELDVIEVKI